MQLKSTFKLILGTTILLLSSFSVFANNDLIEVKVSNSFAGLDVLLTSSKTSPNTDIIFEIETADSRLLKIASKTDNSGVAKARLLSEYTEKSGTYRALAYSKSSSISNTVSLFTISPSSLDLALSKAEKLDYLANVNETVKVDLFLQDKFGNAISNRLIKLIPSDLGLVFEDNNYLSDKNGLVSFYISSAQEKAYFMSFLDISSGKTLINRSRIAFVDNNSMRSFVNSGNSSGPVNYLKFENLPQEIGVLEYVSFTLSAYDNLDQLVNAYRGRVRFSVSSDNAGNVVLPTDYAFVASDQGSHTFSLALLFKEKGSYTIDAIDMADASIKGQLKVDIGLGVVRPPSDSSIIVSSPLSGTYNSNIQTISGKSQAGAKLKIFDNAILLTSLIADFEGNYTYTTTPLVNGEHKLYVVAVDNNDVEIDRSIEVLFSIDTDAPQVLNEQIIPSGDIPAGSDIRYMIKTDKVLTTAKVLFDDNVFDMTAGPENTYFVDFKAPSEAKVYSLGLELKDSLNNELKVSQKMSITIIPAVITMPTITGLIARGSDRRVILTWDNPDNLDEIDFYRIFYGVSPNELNNAIDTFTSSNTWYIPNLQNGVNYYFSIYPVGKNSEVGAIPSNISSARPVLNIVDTISPDILHGVAGSEILNEIPYDVSDSGPGLYALFILTGFVSVFFRFKKRILGL